MSILIVLGVIIAIAFILCIYGFKSDIKHKRQAPTLPKRNDLDRTSPKRTVPREPMIKHFHSKSRFVAIDFETANARYFSACAVGIVVFENLKPTERKSFLIKPPTKFDPENISIHKITPEMVKDSPSFDMIWEQVLPYLIGSKVVMYSDFDAKVLKSLINHFKLQDKVKCPLSIDCFDVCACSRNIIIGLTNYKLPTVCKYLGIDNLHHHDATSDAEACGKIYAWIIENDGDKVYAGHERPATYAQQNYIRILGGEVPPVLSVVEAGKMIDRLIEEDAKKQEEEWARERAEREEERKKEKAEKEAIKIFTRRKKEEDALQLLANEMSSPNYKPKRSRSKRVQDIKDFQILINNVIADSVIDAEEALEVKSWLCEHKILEDDFVEPIKIIDDAIMDGVIDEDETQEIYKRMLDCVTVLKKRQKT